MKSVIYVDGGTNCCVMGCKFCPTEMTERMAEMTGFAHDLEKDGVPIGSGLTKVVHKPTGFQFLMRLHESPQTMSVRSCLLARLVKLVFGCLMS